MLSQSYDEYHHFPFFVSLETDYASSITLIRLSSAWRAVAGKQTIHSSTLVVHQRAWLKPDFQKPSYLTDLSINSDFTN